MLKTCPRKLPTVITDPPSCADYIIHEFGLGLIIKDKVSSKFHPVSTCKSMRFEQLLKSSKMRMGQEALLIRDPTSVNQVAFIISLIYRHFNLTWYKCELFARSV